MPYYSYRAIDFNGASVSGVVDVEDIETAYSELGARGLNVLTLKQAGKLMSGIRKGFSRWGVKRSEIVELAKNLSVIMKAGIPIQTAIEEIGSSTDNKHLKSVLNDINERISMGSSFSNALTAHREVFPDIFIRLAAIGEETGQLDSNMAEVSVHLQRIEDVMSMVKRALLYPIFAVIVTGGALIFWLAFVLPKITEVLKQMNVPLPQITITIIAVSDFTRVYWWLIIGVVILIVVAFKMAKYADSTRFVVDLMKLKMPIVKGFVLNKTLALFSEQMRIMVLAGITIDRSMDIIGESTGSEVFKRAIRNARDIIIKGSRISNALKRQERFPSIMIRMVDIGETSGSLDSQFEFLSSYYYGRLEDITQKLGKTLEPVIMVVLGAMFAVIIVGLLLPIYNLVERLGKGL
jgi:type II secretory pathway component PulF